MVCLNDLVVPGGIFDGARDHGTQTAVAQNLRTIDYTTSGVRVVRLENLGHLTFIDSKHTFISEEKFQGLKQSAIFEGDILVGSFIESSVRVCLLPRLDTAAIAKADCFCVRARPDIVLREYLVLQLASRHTHSALTEKVRGVTRPRITTKHLRALEIPVCPIEEQTAIVKIVRKYFALADAVERQAQAATAQAESLNQSILAKAFRGELVPQDPTDEPASVLLERIRAAREANAETKRPGKRGRKPKV